MNNSSLNVIIADAAIQLAPKSWMTYKNIKEYRDKYNRMPLVDGSKHQHLLKPIPKSERKDRPDILHFGLLTILGYTNLIEGLQPYFSCNAGLFSIAPETNLPRSQIRFYGIVEQILSNQYNGTLITRKGADLNSIPGSKVYFSKKGEILTDEVLKQTNFVFGGFPYGFFDKDLKDDDIVISLSDVSLDLWTALSIFLNAYKNYHS